MHSTCGYTKWDVHSNSAPGRHKRTTVDQTYTTTMRAYPNTKKFKSDEIVRKPLRNNRTDGKFCSELPTIQKLVDHINVTFADTDRR